jgi:hypothetical protein
MVLIYFVASWAEAVCGPYRAEVSQAALRLGLGMREVDVDADMDSARDHHVLQVPAVALEDDGASLGGARPSDELMGWLQERLAATR